MKKRILPLGFALALIVGLLVVPAAAAFSDVPADAWYAADVADVQRYEIINGVGDNRFAPDGTLTLAQAITMAARTYAHENGETIPPADGGAWYEPYLRYAAGKGICAADQFGTDYNGPCSRLVMAQVFYAVFPKETAKQLNDVTALPDVTNGPQAAGVFFLYQQGVLTGNDEQGTFAPDSAITRAQTAAILNRVLDSSKRKTLDWAQGTQEAAAQEGTIVKLTSEQAQAEGIDPELISRSAFVRPGPNNWSIDGQASRQLGDSFYTFLQDTAGMDRHDAPLTSTGMDTAAMVLLYTETKDPDAVARNYAASGGMFAEEAIQDGVRYTPTYLYREYDAGQDLSTFWADLLQAKDPVITPNKRNQLWYDRCGIAVAEKDGQYKVGIYIYDLGMETQNPDGTFTPVEDLPDIDVSAIPGEVCDAVMTQMKDSGAAALPKRDDALDQAAAISPTAEAIPWARP